MNQIHIRRFLLLTGLFGLAAFIAAAIAFLAERSDISASIVIGTLLVWSVINVSIGLMPLEAPEDDFKSLQKLVQAGQQARNPNVEPVRPWNDTLPSDQVFPPGFFDGDGNSFIAELIEGEENKE